MQVEYWCAPSGATRLPWGMVQVTGRATSVLLGVYTTETDDGTTSRRPNRPPAQAEAHADGQTDHATNDLGSVVTNETPHSTTAALHGLDNPLPAGHLLFFQLLLRWLIAFSCSSFPNIFFSSAMVYLHPLAMKDWPRHHNRYVESVCFGLAFYLQIKGQKPHLYTPAAAPRPRRNQNKFKYLSFLPRLYFPQLSSYI